MTDATGELLRLVAGVVAGRCQGLEALDGRLFRLISQVTDYGIVVTDLSHTPIMGQPSLIRVSLTPVILPTGQVRP